MKKVILINFLLIFFIILFLENFLRVFKLVGLQGLDKNIIYQENNISLNKPNKSFKVFGKKTFTGEYGFRVPISNFSYKKDNNFYLILGDSVTFGVGVKEEDSFIGILRNKFKDLNILNTAIIGHNLRSYLYVLKKNNKKFENKIDRVIIFLCLNDIVPYQGVILEEEIKNKNYNIFEKYIKNKYLLKLNVFLREKSYTYILIKGIFTNPIERHFQYMSVLYEKKKNLSDIQKYINKIKIFSEKNNLNLEFVLLPYTYQVQNNCNPNTLKPQNEIIRIFNNLNLKLNDYTQDFCKIGKKNDLFLPYDPVHLSIYGHKYVSDLLVKDQIF